MRARAAAMAVWAATAGVIRPEPAAAQFREDFRGAAGSVPAGWTFLTGDGAATMTFTQAHGLGRIRVDAARDTNNIWWALIKRDVAPYLDLSRLGRGRELRASARVRASAAPRRVNLHFNTQRTTDFHTHLMEFDLPDTLWHTISMTTRGFEAHPGDTVNAQLALMDWGIGRWGVDLDWFRVDVVDPGSAGPDVGEPLPYRPPVPDPASFAEHLGAVETATIDPGTDAVVHYRDRDAAGRAIPAIEAEGATVAVLRWDLRAYAGQRAARAGVLELRSVWVRRAPTPNPELATLRVSEIVGGDPAWQRASVTSLALAPASPPDQIFCGQMIQDVPVADPPGVTRVVISRPVLQRLLNGRTKGLVLRAHSGLEAAFVESPPPGLHFDVERP